MDLDQKELSVVTNGIIILKSCKTCSSVILHTHTEEIKTLTMQLNISKVEQA